MVRSIAKAEGLAEPETYSILVYFLHFLDELHISTEAELVTDLKLTYALAGTMKKQEGALNKAGLVVLRECCTFSSNYAIR